MNIRNAYLPIFCPNRFEKTNKIKVDYGTIFCVSEDTTYQFDSSKVAVPIRAGMVRGVGNGVSEITFGKSVTVEIQDA